MLATNAEDVEALNPHALGAIVRQDVTDPSNFRSTQHFDSWMKANGRIGISWRGHTRVDAAYPHCGRAKRCDRRIPPVAILM